MSNSLIHLLRNLCKRFVLPLPPVLKGKVRSPIANIGIAFFVNERVWRTFQSHTGQLIIGVVEPQCLYDLVVKGKAMRLEPQSWILSSALWF